MLRIGRHDLVARPDAEAAQYDVASLSRRAGESDPVRMRTQQTREFGAEHLALVQDSLKVASARSALLQFEALHRLHGRYGRAGERTKGAGVQVGAAPEHRQSAAHGN